MSFFHRSEGRGKDGIGATDTDGSAAWYHAPTGSAATTSPPPLSSSLNNDHFNDGGIPTASTTETTTAGSSFLHPESSSSNNNKVVFSSNWAQERSCQQIDLENELLPNNANRRSGGCCQNILLILIQGLRIFNIVLGMGLLVYGSLVLQNGHQQLQQILQYHQQLLQPQRELQHLQQQQLYYDLQYASSASASLVPMASLQSNHHAYDAALDNNIAHSQSPAQSPPPPPSSSDQPSDEQSQSQQQQSQQEEQNQQAMAAVLFCLFLGTIHLFSSGIGLLSLFLLPHFHSGYRISAYMGPYLSLLYLSMFIALVVDSDGFILYLQQNAKIMYLSENMVKNVRMWLPVVYTTLGVLGLLESIRYCVLMSEYQELVAQEAEEEGYIPRSEMSTSSSSSRSARSNSGRLRSSGRSGGGRSRNKVSANETLTQALLQDSIDVEAAAGAEETVISKNGVDPNNWWEN